MSRFAAGSMTGDQLKPQAPRILENAEAQATQNQAMNYANNYKKSVGDTLIPTKIDWS